jgi:ABC-type oligopeptide transport system substrate-binding subunit
MDSVTSGRAPVLGRRDFLSRAMALGLGAGVARIAAGDTTAGRELVVLQTSDLTALDPHASTYSSDCRVSFNVFDTLVRRHPTTSSTRRWRPVGHGRGSPPGA